MENIKVSVIMPTYNRMEMVERSILSVTRQTYSNWELIIIDDGSIESLEPIEAWVKKESRIKLIQNKHEGVSAARNRGIEAATGDYIAFLDSDDLFYAHKIKVQLAFMIKKGYDFCHTAYHRINEAGVCTETMYSGKLSGKVFTTLLQGCPIATPTVMIKKSVIKDKRFIEAYSVSQDICFWLDMAYEYELGYIEECLSKVTYSQKSTAANELKVLQGKKNVIAHIRSKPEYSIYKEVVMRKEKEIEAYEQKQVLKKEKNIVIDIPFNIDLSLYIPQNNYIYPKLKATFKKAQTVEWIERRIALFMKYTAKSLIYQTNQEFIAILRCTVETLPMIENVLLKYPSLPQHISFISYVNADAIIRTKLEDGKELYRMTVDSDNMYSNIFIDEMHKRQVRPETQTIISQEGYIYDEKTNRMAHIHHQSPSFYAAIYNPKSYKRLYQERLFENHWKAIAYPYEVIEGDQFCICVHEQNVDNDFERIYNNFKGNYIEGSEKKALLRKWHILESPLQK